MHAANSPSRRHFLTTAAVAGATTSLAAIVSKSAGAVEPANGTETAGLREVRRFAVSARQARSLAVDAAGRLHVAAGRSVVTLDAEGNQLWQIDLPRSARCLDVGPTGELFVGTLRTVHPFDPQGRPLAAWEELGEESIISDISVGEREIAIFDAGTGTIWRYDLRGKRLGTLAAAGRFSAPATFFTLLPGKSGWTVANPLRHRIENYSATGELLGSWGKRTRELSGFAGCCNPVSLAMLSDGAYVTAERGLPHLKIFDAAGNFRQLVAGPETFSEATHTAQQESNQGCKLGGFDLAVDGKDRVYLLDRVANEIRVYA